MARTIKAKEDFLSYGKGQVIPEKDYQVNWSQHVIIIDEAVEEIKPLDLNKDGKVDGQDAQIASKVLNQVKAQLKKKK